MDIRRLTISPIYKGCKSYSTCNPSVDVAKILILDRISIKNQDQKIPRVLRRLPKCLRGWINPKSLVIKSN